MIQPVGQTNGFDEAALVAQAQQGGVEAFTELVNRYESKIFRLAKHITQNPEDAEDVLQETFLKAYEHLKFTYVPRPEDGRLFDAEAE